MSEQARFRRAEDELLRKIRAQEVVCGIMGLGYVGLPLAVQLAKSGYRVLGFEVSDESVNGVNAGISHIKDVSSSELAVLVDEGRITATSDMSKLAECDAISICVPTPLSKTRDPDVSYVVAATESIANFLRRGQLIILESTTYPGTTRELMLPMLEARGLKVGEDFFLCFSPEQVDPGNEFWRVANTRK
jgi:UDP-N-acetyl-D-glucosamine dehydrogenase